MNNSQTNFDPGPWNEISRENGVRILRVPDFASFFEFVNRGFGDTDTEHLWRGQKNSEWELVSSLGRTVTGEEEWRSGRLLSNFQKSVARCSHIEFNISGDDEKSSDTKLKLWSLGQHHGLLTPLIDWTTYPFVALFFAFAEPDEEVENRAVFAIAWDTVQAANYNIATDRFRAFQSKLNSPPYDEEFKATLLKYYGKNFRDNEKWMIAESQIPHESRILLCEWEKKRLRDKRLRIYTPRSSENPRIHSQGGLHIYTPVNVSIEEWIRNSIVDHEVKFFGNVLTKVVIPNSERNAILQSLNRMNINYMSLFPDLEGASKHCNMALDQKKHWNGIREY